jgi:glycosyltransferase involved in cell wall biosynthesis
MENKSSFKNRILFIYAGSNRKKDLLLWQEKKIPDTPLLSANHLKKIENFELNIADFSDQFGNKIEKLIRKFLGFNQIFLFYFFKLFRTDYVISPIALNLLILKTIFRLKTRWIVINFNLNNLLNRSKGIKRQMILFALRNAYKIVCLSNHQRQILLDYGISSEKLKMVHFGVDKDFYQSSNYNEDYILSVGKDNGRDYDTLIKTAKNFREKFIIVCSKRNVISLHEEIPKNVQIIFGANYTDLKELYIKAKLVVITTKAENKFFDGSDCSGQTVILDAMACGKPIIATHRKWMDDYFENGREIFIIDPENPEILVKKIEEIYSNVELLAKVSREARLAIEKKFNSEMMAMDLAKLLKNNES